MTNKEIYQAAFRKWGVEAQMRMVFEEMAELQKELCKYARGAENREQIVEEVADVRIMLEQVETFYECEDLVQNYKNSKIKRLKERLGVVKE